MPDPVCSKSSVRLVHVRGDDRDMLEPTVVASRIDRYRSSLRGKILGQLKDLIPKLQPDDANPRAEDARKMFDLVSECLDIRDLLEGQHTCIEIEGLVHVRNGKADRFDVRRYLRRGDGGTR